MSGWKQAEDQKTFIYELNEQGSNKWWCMLQSTGNDCADQQELESISDLMVQAKTMYELLEMIESAESADLQAIAYMTVVWIKKAKEILAKVRGEG